ncbi:MAG: trypsin-like peptidase domain-containing protein [Nitrososphaerales archaeon]
MIGRKKGGLGKTSVTTFLLLILVTGVGGYTLILQGQVNDLSTQLKSLGSDLRSGEDPANIGSLSIEVDNLRNDIQSVQEAVDELPAVPKEIVGPHGLVGPIGPVGPAGVIEESNLSLISELFERSRESVVAVLTPTGSGSGWVFDYQNHIVTNNHVVASVLEADIVLHDGTVLEGLVIGKDPFSDLAVLQIVDPGISLTPLPIGDSDIIQVGESVIAIGNPFGLDGSVTSGIVSQKGRLFPSQAGYPISNMIQIDVAINPGNSGGALINMDGEVVGVTTGTISNNGGFTGVGFAIPINRVIKVIPILIEQGSIEHPWVGIAGVGVNRALADELGLERPFGLLITFVASGSPAAEVGLRARGDFVIKDGQEVPGEGDVLLDVDGIIIHQPDDLITYIDENKEVGEELSFTIFRDGGEVSVTLTLGVRPTPNLS